MSIRNVCDSSVEQLGDLHRLFHEVSANSMTLDLDMSEFHAATVNAYDAAISFGSRTAGLRASDVNLEATLAALNREGFTGPVLVACDDGPAWTRSVTALCARIRAI